MKIILFLALLALTQVLPIVLYQKGRSLYRKVPDLIRRETYRLENKIAELSDDLDDLRKSQKLLAAKLDNLRANQECRQASITALREAVKALSLDYGQAQAAATHINDYAQGLANIFDYDPMEALRRQREPEVK